MLQRIQNRVFLTGRARFSTAVVVESVSDAMKQARKNPYPYIYCSDESEKEYKYATKKGNFQTFTLPRVIEHSAHCVELGKEIVRAFRTDGLLQINMEDSMKESAEKALAANREYCKMSLDIKSKHVSPSTFSGYIRSGEEQTDGEQDASEIFTVTPDIPSDDWRVQSKMPCHGPVPWPNDHYKDSMKNYMTEIGKVGDNMTKLISLGLGLEMDAIAKLCSDGWHHMRVLHFPPQKATKIERGIGSHTDYGLLVLAAQDDVGALYIRPPVKGELRLNNWLDGHSMAGMYESEDPWTYVTPVPNVLTCFPGDMFQLLTNGYLVSTPHKVGLNATRERFALAYFHEPKFSSSIRTLPQFSNPDGKDHAIHYGKHFTNMFMRCYPNRITTKNLVENGYPAKFDSIIEKLSQA